MCKARGQVPVSAQFAKVGALPWSDKGQRLSRPRGVWSKSGGSTGAWALAHCGTSSRCWRIIILVIMASAVAEGFVSFWSSGSSACASFGVKEKYH